MQRQIYLMKQTVQTIITSLKILYWLQMSLAVLTGVVHTIMQAKQNKQPKQTNKLTVAAVPLVPAVKKRSCKLPNWIDK